MKGTAAVAGLCLFVAFPLSAGAAEFRSGDRVTVRQGETIRDDLYAAGGNVTVQGRVEGSVLACGGEVAVPGVVTGDVNACGGDVDVAGQVGGAIRALGGNVTLSGQVGRDFVASGGTLRVAEGAEVAQDVVAGGGQVVVAGQVRREVLAAAGSLILSGFIDGDVESFVEELTVTEDARIDGNVTYTSSRVAKVADGAQINGRLIQRVPEAESAFSRWLSVTIGIARTLVGMFLLGLIVLLLFPAFFGRAVEQVDEGVGKNAVAGAGLFLLGPLVAGLFLVIGALVGGWWLGLALLALWGVAMALGYVLAGGYIGRWILARAGKGGPVLALLVGLLLLVVVSWIPFLGGLLAFAATIIGVGALARALRGEWRSTPVAAAGT